MSEKRIPYLIRLDFTAPTHVIPYFSHPFLHVNFTNRSSSSLNPDGLLAVYIWPLLLSNMSLRTPWESECTNFMGNQQQSPWAVLVQCVAMPLAVKS